MAYPDWGDWGVPVVPGDPTSEAINQYGSTGLYRSRGGRRVTYENPEFQFTRGSDGRYRPSRPVQVTGEKPGLGQAVEPRFWIAGDEPRSPFVPVLDVRPTPVPATGPESSKARPSAKRPQGQTKSAPKKSAPRPPQGPQWRGVVTHRGRLISW